MTSANPLHCFSRLLLPKDEGYVLFPSDLELQTILGTLNVESIPLFHQRHHQSIQKLGGWLLDPDGKAVFESLQKLCQAVGTVFWPVYLSSCAVIYYKTTLGVGEIVSLRQTYEDAKDLALVPKASLNRELPEKLAEILSRKSLSPQKIPDTHIHRVVWELRQSYSLIKTAFFQTVATAAQSDPKVAAVWAKYQKTTHIGAEAMYRSRTKITGLDEVSLCPYCNSLFEWCRSKGVSQAQLHCGSKKCKAKHIYTKRKEFNQKKAVGGG